MFFNVVRRIPATLIIFLMISGLGVGSALNSDMFANQDAVWGQALIVSGCFLLFMVIRYGVLKFRRDLYNEVRMLYDSRIYLIGI